LGYGLHFVWADYQSFIRKDLFAETVICQPHSKRNGPICFSHLVAFNLRKASGEWNGRERWRYTHDARVRESGPRAPGIRGGLVKQIPFEGDRKKGKGK
jgi:hypothetical protein